MKVSIVQIFNITGLLLTILMNYLATALPLAGKSTHEKMAAFLIYY